jgi:uncharacterized damage-inducible protein DinB
MTEATLTTSNGILLFLYDFSYLAIKRNVDGITHADSLICPPKGGNNMNWVLGHILTYRSSILELAKEQPLWSEGDSAPYATRSKPLDPKDARPFDSLIKDLDATQERLKRGLANLPPEELDLKHEEGAKRPRGAQLHNLHFHESYHSGQLSILRRVVGKPGAM